MSPVDDSAAIATARAYHRLSKHEPGLFAPGPEGLDWATQPNPERRFAGAALHELPLIDGTGMRPYEALYQPQGNPEPLTEAALGLLLELGLGLSAWKAVQGTRWALRNNPSSGNLHPTEGYLVLPGAVGALPAGIHHYAPYRHGLEQRCGFDESVRAGLAALVPPGGFLVGLSSIYWREAWKYGERAYRYCQHDIGHAIGSLRFAAAVLGWRMSLLHAADLAVETLLGLNRPDDFHDAEREEPGCLLLVSPAAIADPAFALPAALADEIGRSSWAGRANRLSRYNVSWSHLDEMVRVARREVISVAAPAPEPAASLTSEIPGNAAAVVRQRRSAVAMDGVSILPKAAFFHMLERLYPAAGRSPWDGFPFAPRLQLALFVHRVDGMDPGLYVLGREAAGLGRLRAATPFRWSRVADCPVPLWALSAPLDLRNQAAAISCGQHIAGDGAFSLGMIAELDASLEADGAWAYRRLFWEAGLIGQVLYLEATALGGGATGIGCFHDDRVHALLGLDPESMAWQSLYHFTVGIGVEDTRLTTLPPFAHLEGRGR